MKPTDKRVYALITAVTLALAGCGGSSSKTAQPDPEPSELENIQAAARKAYTDAKAAADGIAVAGVIPLQTTGMDKDDYHKAKSLVEKDKAMDESGKAKTASDNAAKATTVAAATPYKTAAETAKTAAEKAKADAEKAAMMDVKYSGDMYKVGDQSITPDALKQVITITMADGKVRTQTVGSRDIALRRSPIDATIKQTGAQDLAVGSYIDSQDDNSRLRLISKYTDTKKANVFHQYFQRRDGTVYFVRKETLTAEAPYGGLSLSMGTYKYILKREDGEFYEVTGLERDDTRTYEDLYPKLVDGDDSNLGSVMVESDVKDRNAEPIYGIYSLDFGDDEYRWQRDPLIETTGKTYVVRDRTPDREDVAHYSLITVVKDVTFPVAKSYEHMNYGLWASLKEDGEMPSELGKGFVRTLAGKSMTADMPTEGTAVAYQGHWVANVRKAHEEGTGDIVEMEGGSKTTANFKSNTIKVDLMKKGSDTDKFASLTGGAISGNRFKGAGVTVVETTTSGLKTTGKYTEAGSGFSGAFFGPEAVEVGGVFHFTSKDKKDGEFTGAFGGRKM